MADSTVFEAFLVLKRSNRWRWDLQGRMVANKPTRLAKGEVPVRLRVTVPWALFDEPPILTVEGAATAPDAGDIEAALNASGISVVVLREPAAVVDPEPPDGGEA